MNYSVVMFIGVVGEDIGGHIRTGMTITDEAIDNADTSEFGKIMLKQLNELPRVEPETDHQIHNRKIT